MKTLTKYQKYAGEFMSNQLRENFSIYYRDKETYNFLVSTMLGKRNKEIIMSANYYKQKFNTTDPFILCKNLGISVLKTSIKCFLAYTVGSLDHATIRINRNITDFKSKKVLCAHELGHAILHGTGYNEFNGYDMIKEYEANLFAVAFLFDKDDFNIPLESMGNYILKGILDYNLKKVD